jgi:hypothetical protein
MYISEYLRADNPIAQAVIYVLLGLFAAWLLLLLSDVWRSWRYRSEIKRCEDARRLLIRENVLQLDEPARAYASPLEREKVFSAFRRAEGLKEKSPVSRHLQALFEAGQQESQLDPRALIKNTTDQLFSSNSLHRPALSIFIILGLLGTLLGLADTLASLDSLLRGSTQFNNDTLNQGLQRLLGTLKGAFAPSIWGVLLTVMGVVLFALYLRFVAQPVGSLLERMTLTVWVPQLVPTASQKLQEKLQLSRQEMERSVQAAKEVTEFAEDFEHKTATLRETLGLSTEALQQMTQSADTLKSFTQAFVKGAVALTSFQQELKTLYDQMVNESRVFQESVRRNIAGAEDFQQRIQAQLDSQHQQLTQVIGALRSYETAYLANRGEIDKKLRDVLGQAEQAFMSLSRRNEEIAQALDETLGRPLRDNLAQNLGAVESALQTQLGKVESALQVQLKSLSDRLLQLDAPLNTAAAKFTDTFYNFNAYTTEWQGTLQTEFAKQNETNQKQLARLETLSEQIPNLLQQLTSSSSNFSESSSSFAERGRQLSQDVTDLSTNIAALTRSVDSLGGQLIGQSNGDGNHKVAELLAKQTSLLQQLAQRIERSESSRSGSPRGTVIVSDGGARPKPRWRDRLRKWFSLRRS